MGWSEFALAFVVFLLSHSVPVRAPVKPWLVARVGPAAFAAGYSVLSLVVLAWLIKAAGDAPFVPLWAWAPWQAMVPLAVMLLVCLLLCHALGRPNPFSFGGARTVPFDPARPGVVRLTRHPLLLALALWAAAHLVPNGDLAHVILFGVFAGFAGLGGRIIDRRKQREMGPDWHEARAQVALSPLSQALGQTVTLPRLGAAVALWLALIAAHPWVLGVSPLP